MGSPYYLEKLPQFDGEFFRTASGEIFTLVHQYNRVPEWNMPLNKKYSAVTKEDLLGNPAGDGV
jgi:hypothetical protein